MADFNQQIIDEFRAGGGRVGGMFEGADLVLLTTTGARSGKPRTSPVGYAPDGDRILIFGSNAGLPAHPSWYHNLLANPRVTVERGTETYTAIATPLEGEERDRRYSEQGRRIPAYAAYQEQTTRVIPVVALQRAADRLAAIGAQLAMVHHTLRQDLAAVRAEAPNRASNRAPNLRIHCLTFCGALREHHTTEDGVFPRLEREFPHAAPLLARLREEHAAVARRIQEVERLVTTQGDVTAELDRLATELEAHFAYEERQLGRL
jgi:deazaflavin-dependent oxidoreductase (nitroreductase family)